MQIKNVRSALITNYEVLQLLEEKQTLQKEIQKEDSTVEYPENLRTVQFELTEFLKQTPVSTQQPEQIKACMEALSAYDLTKAEKLQLINLRPKSAVEIYLIIEECEERFGEEDLESLLNSILETLPRDDDEVMEEEEEGEEGEEEEE
ncbi:HRDC-like protein [Sporodiniella umbellata]|nr:HRDC-like protein [Sporodiniella umbellata]